MTCLLVEDDAPVIRHMLDAGYIVRIAADVDRAAAHIHQHRPGLIVLDRTRPREGRHVQAQLRASPEGAASPVPVVSAAADRALAATLDVPVLPKPFDLTHLLERVAHPSSATLRRPGQPRHPCP